MKFKKKVDWLTFTMVNGTSAKLYVIAHNGSRYMVDWGDGNCNVYNDSVSIQHTYLINFTGVIKIRLLRGGYKLFKSISMGEIGQIRLDESQLSKFTKLQSLTIIGEPYFAGDIPLTLLDLEYIYIAGVNSSSTLTSIPNLPKLTTIIISQNSNIIYDLYNIAPLVTILYLESNVKVTYTSGRIWANNMIYIYI